MILVSACLAGINCRYDGKNCRNARIVKLVREGKAIPVCPEMEGGLGVPRNRAEIACGTGADVLDGRSRVIDIAGNDVTDMFIKGAFETLKKAESIRADKAILKARSPSCGSGMIHDGSFTGKLKEGNGVTAELLKRKSIDIQIHK